MKKFYLFLSVLLAVFCTSCKQGSAEFTPYIQVSYFYLNPVYDGDSIVEAEDTLSFILNGSTYVIDTIGREDVVVLAAGFGSYANDLKAVRVNYDTTQFSFKAKLPTGIEKILLPTSDVEHLQLEITPGYNYVSFPMAYQAVKSGVYQFSLAVESDSQFSPSIVSFTQIVR